MRTPTELVDDADVPPPPDEDWTVEVHGSPSRFPGLIKLAGALSTAIAVSVVVAFAIPPILPESWTRGTAERLLGDALGLQVKITGSHDFSLLPSVSLSATGIVADDAGHGTTLEIGALNVDLSAFGLMSASADFNRLSVSKPVVTLSLRQLAEAATRDDEDRSWGWWRSLTVDDLSVTDGRIVILGRDGGSAYDIQNLSLLRATPHAGEAEDGLAFDSAAMVNGRRVTARISTSDPALFVLGNRWPVRLEASSELLRAKFTGALAKRQSLVGDGRIELSSDDAGALNGWIGPLMPARSGSDMTVVANVEVDGDAITVADAEIMVGETNARGNFHLTGLGGGHMRFEGSLDAETLDLQNDGGISLLIADGRTLGTTMLPPGEIAVSWQRLLWQTHEFGLGKGAVERGAGGSRVTLRLEEMDTYGGTLRGRLTLDTSEGMRALDAEATLVNVELGPLAASTSVSLVTPVTGQSTITVNLFSVGADTEQLMEALNGDADVIVTEGVLTVPALTAGVMENERKGIPFRTLTGHFTIAQGVGHSDDLLLRADDVSLVGKGTVDLTDGRIDLDIGRLGAKDGEQRSLKRFRVSGPTTDLTVEAINGS